MSRKNNLNTEIVDYTSVEEFLDEFTGDDPIPPCYSVSLKAVRHKFGATKRYTKQSIIDAVQTYYSEKGWNPAAIRNMRMAISNCSRDNSGRVRHGTFSPSAEHRAAISRAMKGRHWKVIDGKRVYDGRKD